MKVSPRSEERRAERFFSRNGNSFINRIFGGGVDFFEATGPDDDCSNPPDEADDDDDIDDTDTDTDDDDGIDSEL